MHVIIFWSRVAAANCSHRAVGGFALRRHRVALGLCLPRRAGTIWYTKYWVDLVVPVVGAGLVCRGCLCGKLWVVTGFSLRRLLENKWQRRLFFCDVTKSSCALLQQWCVRLVRRRVCRIHECLWEVKRLELGHGQYGGTVARPRLNEAGANSTHLLPQWLGKPRWKEQYWHPECYSSG